MSYSSFELSNLQLDSTQISALDGKLTISVDIANVGDIFGEDVVQLYVRDEEASVARPVLELRGMQRVGLLPGERKRVHFSMHAEQFAYTDAGYRRIIEPGTVTILVGRSSAELPLRTSIEITGPIVELAARRHFLTDSRVS
jgi:beta-glucosidase